MSAKPLLAALLLLAATLSAQKPAAKKPVPPPPVLSHQVNPGRTITFRFRDPAARSVELNLENVPKPIAMTRDKSGVWSYTTPPLAPEIYSYSFQINGQQRLDPENFSVAPNMAFPPSNYVEVPGDTPQPWDLTAVPHGVLHTLQFTSHIALNLPAGQEQVVVYTPPGYDPHAKTPYPVLYLLHGWSGVAESWSHDQQANLILDNLLAQGKVKPMVVVMPTGYGDMAFVQHGFNVWNDAAVVDHNTQLFMRLLTEEIMPLAESSFNISRDRDGRAITGLSMGGLESLDTGLHFPDKFAWIGGFSSAVHNLDYEHQLAALTPQAANLKLLWIACGTEDGLIDPNRKFIAFLKSKNLPVTQVETPGMHVSVVWRDNLVHFAPLLFQE